MYAHVVATCGSTNSAEKMCRYNQRFTAIASRLIWLSFFVLSSAGQAGEPVPKKYKWDFTGVNPDRVSFDFDNDTFDVEGLSTKRITDEYSVVIDDSIVREGAASARFELRTGDRISDGWRAELRDLNNAVPESVVWYSISTLIPEDFPQEPENSYVLIQWHDQKVPWNNPKGHSPPLAARYRDGRLDVTLRHAFEGQKDGENGRELILYSHPNFPRGQWNDFVYQVKWSASSDPDNTGFVRAWLGGMQIIDYTGPVGYFDDLGIYVKFGIYARNDVTTPHTLYHDSYHRGTHYEDVCIDCDEPLTGSGF